MRDDRNIFITVHRFVREQNRDFHRSNVGAVFPECADAFLVHSRPLSQSNLKEYLMKSLLITLFLGVFVLIGSAQAQQEKKSNDLSVTGEIIDVKCYTTGMMGGRGPEHEECAVACIKSGLPVGILDEKSGDVYTIVPARGMKGANEALLKFVAKRVTIKGKLSEKGGARILAYSSVEEVK